MLFDLGYFKIKALAQIAEAEAYFLTRHNHQAALFEGVAGRVRPVELAAWLRTEPQRLVEKPLYLGARERVAVRLVAARVPEAVGNERRRKARANAQKRGYTPSQAQLSLLAWNLFLTNVPRTVWTPATVCRAYALRWQVEICQSQPVKMPWRPLRVLITTIIYLRGLVKREDIGDIDLLPRDDDFLDQALRDRLPIGKGETIEILT